MWPYRSYRGISCAIFRPQGTVEACGEPEPADGLDPVVKGEIEDALARFEQDPRAFMDAIPVKAGAPSPTFSADVIASREFITAKNVRRKDGPADAPGSNDQAKNLVDSLSSR